MDQKNIKIIIEYNGTNFFGSQIQPNTRTVEGEIEKVLFKVFKEKTRIYLSGRTDRGVHAVNQCGNFFVNSKIPVRNIKKILNNHLPNDILIKEIEEKESDFHSRFSAKSRSYIYKIKKTKNFNVFERDLYCFRDENIECSLLNEILSPIIGEHDFDSFRKTDCQSKNTIKTIYELDIFFENEILNIYIKGNSFLKNMIRIIVEMGLDIYTGKKKKNYLIDKLKNPNNKSEKKLAPPQGLYFNNVEYF